jgi:beta-galactosidase/beta-glucuronidase
MNPALNLQVQIHNLYFLRFFLLLNYTLGLDIVDIKFNKEWSYFIDDKNVGKSEKWYSLIWINKHIEKGSKIIVPSNFNTLPGLQRYASTIWYIAELPIMPYQPKSHDYYIEFEGVNYISEVWINGKEIGTHEGGFTPFRFKFSPRQLSLNQANYLVVRVDSSAIRDGIPSNNLDWYNWGGIHRNVQIIVLEKTRVRNIQIITKLPSNNIKSGLIQIKYTIKNPQEFLYRCYIEQEEPQIEYALYYLGRFFAGEQQGNKVLIQTGVQYLNAGSSKPLPHITHEREDLDAYFSDAIEVASSQQSTSDLATFFATIKNKISTPQDKSDSKINSQESERIKRIQEKILIEENEFNQDLTNDLTIGILKPSLWSPESPELYELELRLNGIDEDKYIRFGIRQITRKGINIFLNNKPIKFKGICLHEELVPYGRHYPKEERRKDVIKIKNMGFNAIRSAHYSHDEILLNIADEEGIILFEEVPIYWDCSFKKRKMIKLAFKMIQELIYRDFNHPSVVAWSVGNEIPVERYSVKIVMKILLKWAKKLDPTRIITYASNRFAADPVRKYADITCINAYLGWYYATVKQLNFILDTAYQTNPKVPLILTEFGAGAQYGLRDPNEKFSEDNQARIISYHIKVLNSKPYIAGWFIWIYRDFKSPLRQNIYQKGFNRKGIVDEKNKPKLIARVMNKIIHKKMQNLRHYRGLAYFFGFVLKFLERILWGVGTIGYVIQRKIIKNYYIKHVKTKINQ